MLGVGQRAWRGIAADVVTVLLHVCAAEESLRSGQHSHLGRGDGQGWLSRETVEQTFQHISRYPTPDTLPDTAQFKALLLIVREWQHHMGFTQA